MPRSHLSASVAFLCLLAPALLIAWFHYAYFPAVIIGTRHLWGTPKPLPVGFDFLCRFGFVAYLPLLFIGSAATLSWRFPALRGSLCFAFCAGFLAATCALYAILVSTPALAHGLSI